MAIPKIGQKPYTMSYEEMHLHIGHKLSLSDMTCWQHNREESIEIRCETCENDDPILTWDNKAEAENIKKHIT